MGRRRLRALLLALVPVLAVAGCGRAARHAGRHLTVSVSYDLDSLEPGRRDRVGDFAVLSNLYEPLVSPDANLSARPALAARWENPDQRTWVFHLEEKARFHDGRPVTSADVVFSFERLRDDPSLELRRHVSTTVEEVRALGPRSVLVRTRTPLADFLNRIRFVHIVPAGTSRAMLEQRVNGTGAYRLVSYKPREELVLARSEHYRGPPPPAETATIRLNRSPDAALADVLGGTSDLVQASSKAALEEAQRHPELGLRRSSSLPVKALVFDVARERTEDVAGGRNPFRDLRVRHAVQLALDRRLLVAALRTPAAPAFQLVPRSIFGFDPRLASPGPDAARAHALLAEAGWGGGIDATLTTRRILADGAEAVARLLAPAGIRLKVRALDEQEFFDLMRAPEPRFALALTRLACPTGDAAAGFDAALHGPEPASGLGHLNAGGYASPQVDGLLAEAGSLLDMARRGAVLRQVMRIALRDLPWLPLYTDEDVYLLRPGVAWEPRLDDYVLLEEISVP